MRLKVKIPLGLVFIAFFFCGSPLKAQNPTMDAQWMVKIDNGSQLILELGIRTNTPHEHLGPATFVINFDHTSVVKFNGGSTGAGTSGIDFNWIDSFCPAVYNGSGTVTTVSQPSVGTININFDFVSGTGAAISSTADYTHVVDLIFAVSDPTQSTNVTWNMNELSPPTMDNVFDDNINNPTNFDEGSFNGITVNPLPITLLHFSAKLRNSETVLSWTTASEINNNYFTVERSADGLDFSSILHVPGAGNSNAKNNYTAYDENPLSGASYYRLSQTDFNSASKTFNIVAIDNKQDANSGLSILDVSISGEYPGISYSLPEEGNILMRVTNLNGQVVMGRQIASHKGINTYNFDNASTWKPGLYIVSLYSGDNAVYGKMIKP